ncbi:hypothetical protein ACWGIB_05740 [Streptomyces xiamenensis]
MRKAALRGATPALPTMTVAQDGESVRGLAMRGLEAKTMDPCRAGRRLRVVPTVGHIPVQTFTNGVADRAVFTWIADDCGRSTVKNPSGTARRHLRVVR